MRSQMAISSSPGVNSSQQRLMKPFLRSSARHACADVRARAGFNPGDIIRSLLDFDSWAPKSSRIWRLGHYEHPEASTSGRTAAEDAVSDLEERVRRLAQERSSTPNGSQAAAVRTTSAAAAIPPVDSLDFLSTQDDELASALSRRMAQLSTSSSSIDSSMDGTLSLDEVEMSKPLEGLELRQLIFNKYKKTLDVSIVRRDIPGKSFVSLNILWNHLEQRSFKMTEEQYMEKLDSVAMMVNILGQTTKVRTFLKQKPKSQNGMPARPVVGTAISVRFENLSKEVVEEWFGSGYF